MLEGARRVSARRHVAISVFEARVEAGEISVVLRLGETFVIGIAFWDLGTVRIDVIDTV